MRATTYTRALLAAISLASCKGRSPIADGDAIVDDAGPDAGSAVGVDDAGPADAGIIVVGRLRELFWDAGEGALLHRGWYDTELETDCSFMPGADGRYRCIPSGADVVYPEGSFSFADAACSQPIVALPECTPSLAFALTRARPMPTCGSNNAQPVFAVGGPRNITTAYFDNGVNCVAQAVPADQVFYDVTEELLPSTFVGADLEPVGTAAVAPYAFVADDGAIEVTGAWDDALQGECRPTIEGCGPAEIARTQPPFYGDAECTTRIAVQTFRTRPCAPATAVREFGAEAGLYEVGASVSAELVHVVDGTDTCAPFTSPGDRAFYERGALIEVSTLPQTEPTTTGTGRVVALGWSDSDGNALGGGFPGVTGFFDTELSYPCEPVRFADGYRCAPGNAALLGLFFADSECTQSVVRSDEFTGAPPLALVRRPPPVALCDTVEFDGAHSIGSRVTVAVPYALDDTGKCYIPNMTPDSIFFEAGDPLELPRLEQR